jgi:hypothetical protein
VKNRPADLSYWLGEVIMISNHQELELLLACRSTASDREFVTFAEPHQNRLKGPSISNGYSVAWAIEQVVGAGILPAPKRPLPTVGSRVETMEVGGKPPPACRYGVGVVSALEWDWIFRSWRVEVKFDQPTGGWCGYPILGTHTFPLDVHLIGSGDRPFSDMTPDEIEVLHEVRRQQFWREIDPVSSLHDPRGS